MKQKRYWLWGGIIGAIIYSLVFFTDLGFIFPWPIFFILGVVEGGWFDPNFNATSLFLWGILLYGIIGSLIGLIAQWFGGKVGNRNKVTSI